MKKINLEEKFSSITDYWNPKIAGELNGQHVKLVKLLGPFVWHLHEHEDEMFFVVKGELKMEFKSHTEVIKQGEFIIVPRNTLHQPVADNEVWVMLFEPSGTSNTGNVIDERTKYDLEYI